MRSASQCAAQPGTACTRGPRGWGGSRSACRWAAQRSASTCGCSATPGLSPAAASGPATSICWHRRDGGCAAVAGQDLGHRPGRLRSRGQPAGGARPVRATSQGAAVSTVPPIRREVLVDADPAVAFNVFTAGIGRWWPIEDTACTATAARSRSRTGGSWSARPPGRPSSGAPSPAGSRRRRWRSPGTPADRRTGRATSRSPSPPRPARRWSG